MECDIEVRHQIGTLKPEGKQLSSTEGGAAGGDEFELKCKEIASWASKERRIEQGEADGGTKSSPKKVNILEEAKILNEQLKWSTPKRALLDGGEGKHSVCLDGKRSAKRSKGQRRRRRQQVKTTSRTTQEPGVANVSNLGDDMFHEPVESTASETRLQANRCLVVQ